MRTCTSVWRSGQMPFGVVSDPGATESLAANPGRARMARKSKREWNGIGRPPRAKCRQSGFLPCLKGIPLWRHFASGTASEDLHGRNAARAEFLSGKAKNRPEHRERCILGLRIRSGVIVNES